LAAAEGKEIALEEAENILTALEVLCETGSPEEIISANFLLLNVKDGINDILEGTVVDIAKRSMKGQIGEG